MNQLLTEMDGIEDRNGVFLMAATNRPDIVDPAVLRPGRLDKILYVGLPEIEDRVDILNALTKNKSQPELAEDVDFQEISELTNGYTGADLAGLVRQASLQTLKESIEGERLNDDLKVRRSHFIDAIKKLKPSVGEQASKNNVCDAQNIDINIFPGYQALCKVEGEIWINIRGQITLDIVNFFNSLSAFFTMQSSIL